MLEGCSLATIKPLQRIFLLATASPLERLKIFLSYIVDEMT